MLAIQLQFDGKIISYDQANLSCEQLALRPERGDVSRDPTYWVYFWVVVAVALNILQQCRAPLAAPVRASILASIIRSAAKATIPFADRHWPTSQPARTTPFYLRSSSAPLSVSGLATQPISGDQRCPPASPTAALCPKPMAPRAASFNATQYTAAR